MLSWDLWNAWKLRMFLISGLIVIAINLLSHGILDLDLSVWLSIYLLVSGFYFVLSPQDRVATRWQVRLVQIFFPGAFITTLLPIYTLMLFLAKRGWF